MCEKLAAKRPHSGEGGGHSRTKCKRDDSFCTSEIPSEGSGLVLEDEFPDTSWLYKDCGYCNDHMPNVLSSSLHGEKLVLQMHAQYSVFSKSSRGDTVSKEGVRVFKDEFLQKVCGLRNERGGVLVIHVTEKSPERGPSLDDFDQKVCDELSRMVEDDTLYVENYDRSWHAEQPSREGDAKSGMGHLDYIIVTVKGSSSVSTKDFNTLVTWDGSKERPKAREIARLLWRTELQFCGPVRGPEVAFVEGEKIDLYESRDIQLKRLYDMDLEKDLHDNPSLVGKSLAYRIVYRLKEKLHLLEYITSFAKLRTGGSFYCGIEEEKLKAPVPPTTSEPKTRSAKKRKRKKKGQQKGQAEEERGEDVDVSDAGAAVVGGKDTQEAEISDCTTETYSSSSDRKKTCPNSGKTFDVSNNRTQSEICTHKTSGKNSNVQDLSSALPVDKTSEKENPSAVDKNASDGMKPEHCCSAETGKNGRNSSISSGVPHHRVSNDQCPGSAGLSGSAGLPDLAGLSGSAGLPDSVGLPVPTEAVPHAEGKDYKTGHNVVHGFKLSLEDQEDLNQELVRTIQQDMLWLRTDGIKLTPEDILDEICVRFHCTSASHQLYVMEVCVKRVLPGLVFYKSYGPDTFRLTGLAEKRPRVVRMDPSQWIRLLRKAMECDNCDKTIWKLQDDCDDNF